MPYTFGAGTGDDITWSTTTTIGATARVALVCGWWRPTTLTATRGLWSAGNVCGAEIDSTTDELRLWTDNTTDGQWTTTGVDLAVNEWKFLAFMLSTLNGTPSAAWRVWAGNVETAPQPVTVSVATSPTGNFAGSANFYVGNKGTSATLAFEGDVADVSVVATSSTAGVTTHPFGVAAIGAITDAEALHVYETLVLPCWLGDVSALWDHQQQNDYSAYHCGLDWGAVVVGNSRQSATLPPLTPTINGATWSQNGAPRPNPGMDTLPRRRR